MALSGLRLVAVVRRLTSGPKRNTRSRAWGSYYRPPAALLRLRPHAGRRSAGHVIAAEFSYALLVLGPIRFDIAGLWSRV
jgi:hypothetical protein